MLKYGFKASRRLIYGFYCLRHKVIARISKIPVWSCQKLIQDAFGFKYKEGAKKKRRILVEIPTLF